MLSGVMLGDESLRITRISLLWLICDSLCRSSIRFFKLAHSGTVHSLTLHCLACCRHSCTNCLQMGQVRQRRTWSITCFIFIQDLFLQLRSLHRDACTNTSMVCWTACFTNSLWSTLSLLCSTSTRPSLTFFI